MIKSNYKTKNVFNQAFIAGTPSSCTEISLFFTAKCQSDESIRAGYTSVLVHVNSTLVYFSSGVLHQVRDITAPHSPVH